MRGRCEVNLGGNTAQPSGRNVRHGWPTLPPDLPMTPQFIATWIKQTAASVSGQIDRKALESGLPLLPVHREIVEDAAAEALRLGLLVAYSGMCGLRKLTPEQYSEIERWVRHEAGVAEKVPV